MLFRTLLILHALMLLMGVAGANAAPVGDIYVTILPQKYLVERIAGDRFQVHVMVGPGESPATYDPKPRQIAGMKQALLYYRMGMPFENSWIPKLVALYPRLQVLDAREGIELRHMEEAHHHHHETADHEDGHEAGLDPHLWLNPKYFGEMGRRLMLRLSDLSPGDTVRFRDNYAQLKTDLLALDRSLAGQFTVMKNRRFLTFHPSWGYLAEAYGLQQMTIEVDGKSPGAATLQRIIDQARQSDIHTIFVQPQFDHRQAELIAAEIGGRVVAIDPLAEDYLVNLRKVAEAFTGEEE